LTVREEDALTILKIFSSTLPSSKATTMPQLTVFFVRNGESLDEVEEGLRLNQRIDPPLTFNGYKQAQDTYTALFKTLCDKTPIPPDRCDSDDDGVIDPLRNLACFSAPLRSCQATVLMMTTAGLAQQDKLTWRYTTLDAARTPSAVPVITVNDLCRQQPEIQQCGGVDTVIDAGLLHTAAREWNVSTTSKSPFAKVSSDMKKVVGEYVREWKGDRSVHPPRQVLEVQYLRIEDMDDPWSLTDLTPKINASIDLLEPVKYVTPPRKGSLDCKLADVQGKLDELAATPVQPVKNCIYKARQVGCDTCIFTVPATVMDHIMEDAGAEQPGEIAPCSVLTLLVDVEEGGEVSWNFVGLFDSTVSNAVPEFPGPVDCSVPPPPDKDPSSVPANQWARFPPPEPENISADYPDLYVDCGCYVLACVCMCPLMS
jgi:hypothetical protein